MNWLFFAVLAYMIMALSQLFDKALLNVAFKEVKAYVFLIGALGALVFVLLPFGVSFLDLTTLIIALIGGALFVVALLPFLSALQGDDASRVIPLIGGTIPMVSLLGEVIFLNAQLARMDYVAFALLVAGAIVLTFTKSENSKRSWSAVVKALIGAVLFGSSFVITKYVFNEVDFINGFFWMRMGGLVIALILIARRDVRQGLKQFFKNNKPSVKLGYFGNQGLNGAGFVLQNYAISLASVGLVNAMQGVQYIFVILFIVIASKFKPGLLGEKIIKRIIVEKITAILIIMAGIALLAL